MPPGNSASLRSRERKSFALADLFLPLTANWLIIFYAVLALAGGWAYASLRIRTDYDQTLDSERNRLRAVAAALQSGTRAMINDGVGAAEAGVNAVMSGEGDIDPATGDQRTAALAKMLTGGAYVRSLFIYSPGRFARAGREGARETANAPPAWLDLPRSSLNGATWVGKPMADPDLAGEQVIPIARHIITPDRDGLWAGALVEFAAFDAVYRQFGHDLRVMGILRADGTVLAMVPSNVAPDLRPGVSVAENALFRLGNRRPESGVVEGFGTAMGTQMLYGYERVYGYDMTILAGQARNVVLAPWRDRRRTTLMVTGVASTLIVLMTGVLGQHLATRRRMKAGEEAHAERTHRQSRALLAFASRHGSGWGGVQAALHEICEQACDVMRTDRVAVWMLGPGDAFRSVECFECSGRRHHPGMRISGESVPRYLAALRAERVIDAEDAHADPRTSEWVDVLSIPAPAAMIAAPVRCSGKLAGVVTFEHGGATRAWEVDEVAFAGGVADQVAQAHTDSEREQALEDLRRTAGELMRLQDEERRRIGRDLHDSTGQTLAALELSLSRLLQASPAGADRRELLEECVNLASQCSAEIRTASYLLHPPLLDELGLLSALRWLTDGFHQRSGIDVRLELPPSMGRLSRDEELTLFRVAQEALTNVHRHAQSASAILRLFIRDAAVTLEVEDAGVGMRSVANEDSRSDGSDTRPALGGFALGVGLAGMRERIRQVGGSLNVEARNTGTLVRATLPVARMNETITA